MIITSNDQEKIEVTEELEKTVSSCIQAVLEYFSIHLPLEISVVYTDNQKIRGINKEFRGMDKETDVLSFPQFTCIPPGILPKEAEQEGKTGLEVPLGDIVLSLEQASMQAEEYGHSFFREAGYLTVHSMLHLLGFDHMSPEEKEEMREKEEAILGKQGLTR